MKRMRTIVGIICIVLFTACSESREEAVYRLVKEWTGAVTCDCGENCD